MVLRRNSGVRLVLFFTFWAGAPVLCPGQPTTEAFFDRAGAGLRGVEEQFGEYWRPHIGNSHGRILQAADAAQGRERALVLGAGNCTEIPLEALAERFKQVVIVDLDRESLEQAVAALPPGIQKRVEIRVSDVTSFAQPMMERIRTAIEASATAKEAFENLGEILDAVPHFEKPPALPDADLVVSSLVLSELDRYPRTFADQLLRQKFSVRLRDWPRYDQAVKRLQEIAIKDHIRLLRMFCRSSGAIYYADTVARGPLYARISSQERQSALRGLVSVLSGRGFLQALLEPEARAVFSQGLQARKAQRGDRALDSEEVAALLRDLSESRASADDLVIETILRMMCLSHFPVEAETALLERLLATYQSANAEGFERLVPVEIIASAWTEAGLAPNGPSVDWWWLEYPCSVSFREGAFRVKSWILKTTTP
jgi:hypothetical protein